MIPPTPRNAADLAMFLDFDGTLVEIAAKPDAVLLSEATRATMVRLHMLLDGALAIVTGREIEVIDAFLAPLHLPVAGIHGLTRRDACGQAHAHMVPTAFLDTAELRLGEITAKHPKLLVERKSHAIAIHYRADPSCEGICLDVMEHLAALADEVRLVRGKMVIEARPAGGDKGSAVAAFMSEAPFHGRRPFFAGDDVTDEDAFRVVNDLGGISLKIGHGDSAAGYRLADTSAFLGWLSQTADALERGHSIG